MHKNHTITNITFTKGKSLISAVGPLIGSGANGETTSLLKADDGDTVGRIKAIQGMMTQLKKGDEALAESLATSLKDLAKSLAPVEDTVEVEGDEPEVDAEVQPELNEGGAEEETTPEEDIVPTSAVDPAFIATSDVAETPVAPQPSLVVKSDKELTMATQAELDLKAQNEELTAKMEVLQKAENARVQEVCLNKAKSLESAIGQDAVEPLSKALFAIAGNEALTPIEEALVKAANLLANAGELKDAEGHGLEVEADNFKDVEANFERLSKSAQDAGDKVDIKDLYRQASELADKANA